MIIKQRFSLVCCLAREVNTPVVIHFRGTASTGKECLWIMKSNLPKNNVVFGVTPATQKEQLE